MITAGQLGLDAAAYQRLCLLGCPTAFFQLIMAVQFCRPEPKTTPLVMLEMFCGVAAITRAFTEAGYPSMGYDYLKDPVTNNVLSSAGFACALSLTLSLDPMAGFLWLATVCSSWVWISSSSTGRTVDYPLGVPCESAASANCMVARCGLLVVLAISRGCIWALEQPASSLTVLHPAMVWIRQFNNVLFNADWFEADTCMGAFSAGTIKPTKIYGNRRLVLSLGRSRAGIQGDSSRVCTVRVNEVTGQKQTSGSSELKQTQAYTDSFGAAVLDGYEALGAPPAHQHAEPTEIDFGPAPSDVWGLADLDQVLHWAYPS